MTMCNMLSARWLAEIPKAEVSSNLCPPSSDLRLSVFRNHRTDLWSKIAISERLTHRSKKGETSVTSLIVNDLTRNKIDYTPVTCNPFSGSRMISYYLH